MRDKTINILVQHGIKRHPELPDVPTSVELGRTPDEVAALRVFASASDVGRFILSTPDTPADRIQALRRAFDAMVKDPEFMADLKTQKLELGPLQGRGAAAAGGGSCERLAGDDRARPGHLFRELISAAC